MWSYWISKWALQKSSRCREFLHLVDFCRINSRIGLWMHFGKVHRTRDTVKKDDRTHALTTECLLENGNAYNSSSIVMLMLAVDILLYYHLLHFSKRSVVVDARLSSLCCLRLALHLQIAPPSAHLFQNKPIRTLPVRRYPQLSYLYFCVRPKQLSGTFSPWVWRSRWASFAQVWPMPSRPSLTGTGPKHGPNFSRYSCRRSWVATRIPFMAQCEFLQVCCHCFKNLTCACVHIVVYVRCPVLKSSTFTPTMSSLLKFSSYCQVLIHLEILMWLQLSHIAVCEGTQINYLQSFTSAGPAEIKVQTSLH